VRRLALILSLFAVAACGSVEREDAGSDSDTDVDTDADTDADSDTGSDTDSDTDSGSGTGTGTDTLSGPCQYTFDCESSPGGFTSCADMIDCTRGCLKGTPECLDECIDDGSVEDCVHALAVLDCTCLARQGECADECAGPPEAPECMNCMGAECGVSFSDCGMPVPGG